MVNKQQVSKEQIKAAEMTLKRKHGNKLPFLFIALYAAICSWIEMVSPATTYGGHFMRLAFFGWFSWIVCKNLEAVASRWKNETPDDCRGKGAR